MGTPSLLIALDYLDLLAEVKSRERSLRPSPAWIVFPGVIQAGD